MFRERVDLLHSAKMQQILYQMSGKCYISCIYAPLFGIAHFVENSLWDVFMV